MENKYWKQTIGTLIGAIWLYTLAGIAGNVIDVVDMVTNPMGIVQMLQSLIDGDSSQSLIDTTDILGYLATFLMLIGYVLFYKSLVRFIRLQQSEADRLSALKIRNAYLLIVIGLIMLYIPLLGTLANFVLCIVAYSKLISAYGRLGRSPLLPQEASWGMRRLRAAHIWILVAYIVGIIPVVGSAFEGIVVFVTFFVILSGWGMVKRGAPSLLPEEEARLSALFPPLNAPMAIRFVVAFFLINTLILCLKVFVGLTELYMLGNLIMAVFWLCLLCWRGQHLPETSLVGVLLMFLLELCYLVINALNYADPATVQEYSVTFNTVIQFLTYFNLLGIVLWISSLRIGKSFKATVLILWISFILGFKAIHTMLQMVWIEDIEPSDVYSVYRSIDLAYLAVQILILIVVGLLAWQRLKAIGKEREQAEETTPPPVPQP